MALFAAELLPGDWLPESAGSNVTSACDDVEDDDDDDDNDDDNTSSDECKCHKQCSDYGGMRGISPALPIVISSTISALLVVPP